MAKRITRRQVRSWLAPMRACFAEMKTGLVDSIRGYPVTRLHTQDDYARIDYCIAGFRALIDRLCVGIDCEPLATVERRLAAGVPLTIQEIDAALSLLKRCEEALMGHTIEARKDAVRTEQISIELEAAGLKEAA